MSILNNVKTFQTCRDDENNLNISHWTPYLSWTVDILLEGHCRYCWKRRSNAWPIVLITSWASPSEHSSMWHAEVVQITAVKKKTCCILNCYMNVRGMHPHLFCWQGPLLHRQQNLLYPTETKYSLLNFKDIIQLIQYSNWYMLYMGSFVFVRQSDVICMKS